MEDIWWDRLGVSVSGTDDDGVIPFSFEVVLLEWGFLGPFAVA